MTRWIDSRASRVVVVIVLVCVLIGAQGVAARSVSGQGESSTARSLGHAGFAYLGGLRTFAAAVLWNRIEPLFHEYYAGKPIEDQTYMMPTLRLVTILDPHFAQAYYVASWIASRRVSKAEGLSIARAGVAQNPSSGLLQANLVQLLFIQDKTRNRAELMRRVKLILSGKLTWSNSDDYFDGLAITVEPLRAAGENELANKVTAELEKLKEQGIGQGAREELNEGK